MELTLPNIQTLEIAEAYGKFIVEPLERGFGVTLGNALRRVLLSSIPGAAITFVKIDGVLHEFQSIPGVREDTTEILLNLKDLHVKIHSNGNGESKKLRIERKGEGVVTGGDIECPEDVEIVNPEAVIANISDENGSLNMELEVELGKGYVLPDRQERRNQMSIGTIPMGSAFTPVRKVNYTVEATRVASNTDFERLVLEIWTNGTITPQKAMSKAAHILSGYFNHFAAHDDVSLPTLPGIGYEDFALADTAPNVRIEELDFSVRTYNCLKKANILTISDLIQYSESDLMQIRNFGKKSLDEVYEKLDQLNLTLKGGPSLPGEITEYDTEEDADMEEEEDE